MTASAPAVAQQQREQGIANCQDQQDRTIQRAISSCTQIINSENEPNDVRAAAFLYRGRAQRRLRQYDGALADVNEAIRLRRNWAEAHYERGLVRLDTGNRYRAIDDFSDAIQANPQFGIAWLHRAVLRRSWGDLTGATADYNEALRLDPTLTRSPLAADMRRPLPQARQSAPGQGEVAEEGTQIRRGDPSSQACFARRRSCMEAARACGGGAQCMNAFRNCVGPCTQPFSPPPAIFVPATPIAPGATVVPGIVVPR
ncbi:tetratricopeptide repeat protein [Neoroseomonas oryzicola]|uniref:tetratricopeptide repeat protein n=1 Tax=Neoroseomonas oryzicola TaxID=535904 RepID=UPI0038D0E122